MTAAGGMIGESDRVDAGAAPGAQDRAWLVYDGQCPFCSSYVKFMRLKESVGAIRLVDARAGGPEADECKGLGFDLDKGMVFKFGGRHYFGADAINAMSMLSSRVGLFNRLCAVLFRSPGRAAAWYPFMRLGRKGALRLLGRSDL